MSDQKGMTISKVQDRNICRRDDGKWANKRQDASKPSSVHNTQADAIDAAWQNLQNQARGEMSIQGHDGRIRAKDIVHPGNDPRSIKG